MESVPVRVWEKWLLVTELPVVRGGCGGDGGRFSTPGNSSYSHSDSQSD